MKHLVCIYILLFALAMPHLNSCQRANTRQELERADSLLECVPMDTNAITELLDKVGAKPNELSHNDSMYYGHAQTRLSDKAILPPEQRLHDAPGGEAL